MFNHQDLGLSGLMDEIEKRIVTTLLTQSIDDSRMGFVRLSAITKFYWPTDDYQTIYSISWRLGSNDDPAYAIRKGTAPSQAGSDEEISGELEFNISTSKAVHLYQETIRKII